MTEPYTGQLRIMACNFAPRGYANCDGQLLAVNQNDALFALLGTIYGGDGRTTFGLPDLRGRIPIHMGSGPGLTNRPIGNKSGAENVALTAGQVPTHNHTQRGTSAAATTRNPVGAVPATANSATYTPNSGGAVQMASGTIAPVGGGQNHNNMAPFQVVRFVIALFGVFPSRS